MAESDGTATGLDVGQLTALMEQHFPQVHEGSGRLEIESAGGGAACVRMHQDERMLRPGGTVSGPMMFKLADFAVYVAILADRGTAALQAVTSNMTMNFLSRPAPGDLVAQVKLLKVGRRLAVAEVALTVAGSPDLVAHATATYALPPPSARID
ncbi:MAG: PaaI family thioesterase [Hyphomicrobiaceae bacterium]|jgi:uncharacterized protein (TIGR00369 family)